MVFTNETGLESKQKIHPYKQYVMGYSNENLGSNNIRSDTERESPASTGYSIYKSDIENDDTPDTSNKRNSAISIDSINLTDNNISQTHSQSSYNQQNLTNNIKKKRTKSIDLSHLYQMTEDSDANQIVSNELVANVTQETPTSGLVNEETISLTSRLDKIETYRENVKKSKDPLLLFEYVKYILQTALSMEDSNIVIGTDNKFINSFNEASKDSITVNDIKKQLLKESHHHLKKLSVKGYADAQYLLGDALASGAFGRVDNKEAFNLFQSAAKHGHVESAYRTAYCLENGLGAIRDSRKSLDFLKFAASRNHPSSMFKLGLYSFYGKMGISDDVNTKQNGIKWLSRAAARANEMTCAAPYELGKIYQKGFLDIIIPDEKYATELFIQSASLGHTPSATLLGQLYETGNTSIKQDISLSVHYYTQASMKGNPIAMMGLCAWYLLGAEPAFAKDEEEAFQWAYKAAKIGYHKAQFTLGYFYEHGKGCGKDMDSAWEWYEIAANNNDSRARKKLKSRQTNHNTDATSNSFGKLKKKRTKSISTVNLFANTDDNLEEEMDGIIDESLGKMNNTIQNMSEPSISNPSNTYDQKINTDHTSSETPKYFNTAFEARPILSQTSPLKISTSPIRSSSPSRLNNRSSNSFNDKKKKKDCIIM